jgi:geranylgeranyl pyrophosphate synthase
MRSSTCAVFEACSQALCYSPACKFYDYCVALQVVDDILDFTGSALALGKPALNDLRSGLATAPVLFAAEVRMRCSPPVSEVLHPRGLHKIVHINAYIHVVHALHAPAQPSLVTWLAGFGHFF